MSAQLRTAARLTAAASWLLLGIPLVLWATHHEYAAAGVGAYLALMAFVSAACAFAGREP